MSAMVKCPNCGHEHVVFNPREYFQCPKCGWVLRV